MTGAMGDTIGSRLLMAGGGIVALALVGALLLYAWDYGVGATVVDKGVDQEGHFIVFETDAGGLTVKHYLPLEQWASLNVGNHVIYHVQTGRVQVYTAPGGVLLYDSG